MSLSESSTPVNSPKRSRSSSCSKPGTIYAPSFIHKSKYKTEICRQFLERGTCPYGVKCQFAHSIHELQSSPNSHRYKTEVCRQFELTGLCQYGSRCRFLHPRNSLTPAGLLNRFRLTLDDEKVVIDLVDTLSVSQRSKSMSEPSVTSTSQPPSFRRRSYSCHASISTPDRLPIFRRLTLGSTDPLNKTH
ncbi:hypothetical protein GEMRC1_006846 [Eukaryota sp. GEM-RC1]